MLLYAGVDHGDNDIGRSGGGAPDERCLDAVAAIGPIGIPHVPLLGEERITGDDRSGRCDAHRHIGLCPHHVSARLELRGSLLGLRLRDRLGELQDARLRRDGGAH